VTDYTGTVKSVRASPGAAFPFVNPMAHGQQASYSLMKIDGIVETYCARLAGTQYAAIGTDTYTYTLFKAPRKCIVRACYIIDPFGQTVDATNYNTYELIKTGPVTMCSRTDQYSISQLVPWEVSLAATSANRTLAAGNTVTLKISGTVLGKPITDGAWVVVVCELTE